MNYDEIKAQFMDPSPQAGEAPAHAAKAEGKAAKKKGSFISQLFFGLLFFAASYCGAFYLTNPEGFKRQFQFLGLSQQTQERALENSESNPHFETTGDSS